MGKKKGKAHEGKSLNDRFTMTVKESGKEVLIQVSAGEAAVSKDRKTVTITYSDPVTKKPSKSKKAKKAKKAKTQKKTSQATPAAASEERVT